MTEGEEESLSSVQSVAWIYLDRDAPIGQNGLPKGESAPGENHLSDRAWAISGGERPECRGVVGFMG